MTRAFLGGDFAALVTPFGSGGAPSGIFCLTREGLSLGEATAVVTMHTVLTGLFFLVVGFGAALALPLGAVGTKAVMWTAAISIVATLALITLLIERPHAAAEWLHRQLSRKWLLRVLGPQRAASVVDTATREADKFAVAVRLLGRARPWRLGLSFVGLSLSRLCLVACLPAIMLGLGWHGSILRLAATAVGALAVAIISPTPGGSGATEATLTALLATQGPASTAAAAALTWRGVTFYPELFAGWVVFGRYLAMEPLDPEDRLPLEG